jgi:hypothetical protein
LPLLALLGSTVLTLPPMPPGQVIVQNKSDTAVGRAAASDPYAA